MSSSGCSVGCHSSCKPAEVVQWGSKINEVLKGCIKQSQQSIHTCISRALCMLTQNAIFSTFVILLRSTVSNLNRINLKDQISVRRVHHKFTTRNWRWNNFILQRQYCGLLLTCKSVSGPQLLLAFDCRSWSVEPQPLCYMVHWTLSNPQHGMGLSNGSPG
jgi:hypothetical protein